MQLKELWGCLGFAGLCPTALPFLVFYKINVFFWFCLLGDDSLLLEVPRSMCCDGEETPLFYPGQEVELINLPDKLHVLLPPAGSRP